MLKPQKRHHNLFRCATVSRHWSSPASGPSSSGRQRILRWWWRRSVQTLDCSGRTYSKRRVNSAFYPSITV